MGKPFDKDLYDEFDPPAKDCLISLLRQYRPKAKIIYLEDEIKEQRYGDVSMEFEGKTTFFETEIKEEWTEAKFQFPDINFMARKLEPGYDRVEWFHICSGNSLYQLRVTRKDLKNSNTKIIFTKNNGYEKVVKVSLDKAQFFGRKSLVDRWKEYKLGNL